MWKQLLTLRLKFSDCLTIFGTQKNNFIIYRRRSNTKRCFRFFGMPWIFVFDAILSKKTFLSTLKETKSRLRLFSFTTQLTLPTRDWWEVWTLVSPYWLTCALSKAMPSLHGRLFRAFRLLFLCLRLISSYGALDKSWRRDFCYSRKIAQAFFLRQTLATNCDKVATTNESCDNKKRGLSHFLCPINRASTPFSPLKKKLRQLRQCFSW